jgi:1,2-phenylacetyl-CoA epoxidase catalytic subunit
VLALTLVIGEERYHIFFPYTVMVNLAEHQYL